ncbi:uncharacterized protein C05D11.1-like [Coccinella septempunctata]|uniref:uncharacterized protein C05D11.1-like n=1 Tax=Coccinella septempunctata TaxID=41139 RepID=UPI001D061B35|nr:uncharacterized protein C05D11.1-like [Coccinella septempunctata]XP_044752460.1 uncharacterized protein C05D11.1-like [Coccinella septempunctata]
MPPVDKTPNVISSSFQLVYSTKAYNKIPIFEYESTTTGLTVVIAEVDGPIVNGFFCIATEAFDDDGLPHTLEHLIFLGSEEYPYKGVLDLLANRCFASGTNAWTDVDHTCYTMETAGSQGFLALMPIYLEHILYPTLTDAGFITEVHHITPTGEDAGVVYCEMQGRENSAESRLHLTLSRLMYPGKCGYSSETGGIMQNLRESTSNEKIKNYHKELYRPENLKIIITGRVEHEIIFKSLSKLEEKIVSKGNLGPFQRPWQSPVPPLEKSTDIEVKYPADDESNGLFCIAWRGASTVKDQYTVTATSLMLKYLSDFSVSPLQKELVEIEDPYASEITYNLYQNSETCNYLTFQDVPVTKLEEIKSKLFSILSKIVENEDINMERIESIIKRHRLECTSYLECDPHSTVAFLIIGHVLYGNTKEDLEQRVNPLMDLDSLRREPKSFWVSLLRKYFLDNKFIAIRCKPSKEEKQKMAQEEKERIAKQIESLGPEGLEIKKKELEKAVEFNEREPLEEMLVSLPIPEMNSIHYHNIVRLRTDSNSKRTLDLSETPVFTFFDDVNSNFVYIYALLDTKNIQPDTRNFLPLFFETLLELPIMKEGQLIPYEKVVAELYNDTVQNSAHLGSTKRGLFKCGSNSTTAVVMLQVECSNFQKGLEWLKDILYNTVFTADRLKVTAKKMLNSVAQAKRSGSDMVSYAMKALCFSEDSNILRNGVLNQNKFLSNLVDELDGPKADEIVKKFCEIKKLLSEYKNFSLYLAGNLRSLPNPSQIIKETFVPGSEPPKCLTYTRDYELIETGERNITGCIIGMGCLESSFFIQSARTITDPEDPDVPALNLFLQYLTQAEGPIWKQVRGKGFAYGYSMVAKYHEGFIYLTFHRATNVVGAYKETHQIVTKQITSKQWDETLLDAAKNSLMFEVIAQEKTIGDVVYLSVSSYLHGVDYNYNRNLINSIKKVTVDDLNRVGEKYVAPLFESSKVNTAVVTDPSRIEEIQNGLKEFGLDLKVYQSLEDSFLNEKCSK